MSDELLLAIDCGTGSARAALFDLHGRVIGLGSREWRHATLPGAPGSQVFDTAANWLTVCACIREALACADGAAGRIAAVSATSMREGMVLYDARGEELWACPNVDGRAGAEAAELVASGAADEIYARGGDWVSITAPARLRWLARHEPRIFAAIDKIGMLGDWVLTRLCGAFVTDPSLGSSSGMFDLGRRTWSEEIVRLCELEPAVFPEVVDSGTVIGEVTGPAAELTGLRRGTPVVAGGADTQLALVGVGVADPGRLTVIGGSFWQFTALADTPVIDPERRLRTLCHAVPGRWMVEGIGFYCGITMRWFRDAFCAAEKAAAAEQGIDVYDLLEQEASAVPPGCGGLFAIFSNLMDAKRWVHAAPSFIGFDVDDAERSGRRECFRAIEESAAFVARGHLDMVSEIAGAGAQEVVFTGGAAKGVLWPQILADVLGLPVRIPAVKESSALGAAIYAGTGAGLFGDPAAAGALLVSTERTVEPDPERVALYADLYDRWRLVYQRALDLTDTGAVRPLWRAAGT